MAIASKTKKTKEEKAALEVKLQKKEKEKQRRSRLIPLDASIGMITVTLFILFNQVYHSTLLAAEAYSSPSIIMAHKMNDGSRLIVDDYREAYYWLK